MKRQFETLEELEEDHRTLRRELARCLFDSDQTRARELLKTLKELSEEIDNRTFNQSGAV